MNDRYASVNDSYMLLEGFQDTAADQTLSNLVQQINTNTGPQFNNLKFSKDFTNWTNDKLDGAEISNDIDKRKGLVITGNKSGDSKTRKVIIEDVVGIGTDSPAGKLDVNGNAIFRGPTNFTGLTTINDTLNIAGKTKITGPVVSSNNISIGELDNKHSFDKLIGVKGSNAQVYASTTNGIKSLLYAHPEIGAAVGSESNHDLAFLTNYKEKARITKDGNVGIGINNPAAKLDVNGNVNIRGHLNVNNLNTDWNTLRTKHGYIDFGPNNAGFAHIYTDRPKFAFNKPIDTLGADISVGNIITSGNANVNGSIVSSNNISIGELDNKHRWDKLIGVKGSNAQVYASTTNGIKSLLYAHPDIGAAVGSESNHDLAFLTNYKEKARITKDGNVGIGTTNPTAKLHVNGGIKADGFANEYLSIGGEEINTTKNNNIYLQNRSNGNIVFGRNKVSINTTSGDLNVTGKINRPNKLRRLDTLPGTGAASGTYKTTDNFSNYDAILIITGTEYKLKHYSGTDKHPMTSSLIPIDVFKTKKWITGIHLHDQGTHAAIVRYVDENTYEVSYSMDSNYRVYFIYGVNL